MLFASCGIQISSNKWQEDNTLTIYGLNDGLYNFEDRAAYIKLTTFPDGFAYNRIWRQFSTPLMKVLTFYYISKRNTKVY